MSSGRRQQWGCGTFLALALVLGAIIAYWYIAVPVLVVLVIGAITMGAARGRNGPTTTTRPREEPRSQSSLSPALEAEHQALHRRVDALSADLRRQRHRPRCDWCGAPRAHGAERCRFCGRSLQIG
jgi:hypothetical protein